MITVISGKDESRQGMEHYLMNNFDLLHRLIRELSVLRKDFIQLKFASGEEWLSWLTRELVNFKINSWSSVLIFCLFNKLSRPNHIIANVEADIYSSIVIPPPRLLPTGQPPQALFSIGHLPQTLFW